MKPRIHSRPLSLALAAMALWGLTSPTPGIAQSRQSGKPGSRASAPAPRAKWRRPARIGTGLHARSAPAPARNRRPAKQHNRAPPRRVKTRTAIGVPPRRRADESTGSRQRTKADAANDRREPRVVPQGPSTGRERGDRPATGVAVPRGPRVPGRPSLHVPRYYRYPYLYGYPYAYPYFRMGIPTRTAIRRTTRPTCPIRSSGVTLATELRYGARYGDQYRDYPGFG